MIITKERIKELKPCADAWKWYLETEKEKITDLKELLLITNKENASWARWLFTKLMTREQKIEIAIFAAELVIDIFEKKHPNDDRPRKAILAAKKVLEIDTPENRKYAYAYADAADAADAAAYTAAYAAAAAAYAAAAAAAAAAAYAAAAAADAAAAYAAAAAAAAAADAYARLEIQEKIIIEAVRILDRECK